MILIRLNGNNTQVVIESVHNLFRAIQGAIILNNGKDTYYISFEYQ